MWEESRKELSRRKFLRFTAVVLKGGKVKFLELSGHLISKAKDSLCFLTRYPLSTGHVLEFREAGLNYTRGVVVWIRRLGCFYMTGARLIGNYRVR